MKVPAIDLAAVHEAVDAVTSAKREADEARNRFLCARDEAHGVLRIYGGQIARDGGLPPRDLMRFLYWERPLIHAQEIVYAFSAFGIRCVADLHKLVGPDGHTEDEAKAGHERWISAAPDLTTVTRIGTGDGAVPDMDVTLTRDAGPSNAKGE